MLRAALRELLILRGEQPHQLGDGVVEAVDDAFLERDDGVIGNVNMFRTDFRAAFCDVAVAQAGFLFDQFHAVIGVERVHFQGRQAHEKARPGKGRLVVIVIADDMADVLT